MICFRDKSYCAESDQCANQSCVHNFTDAECQAARRWWGNDDAPIAFMPMKEGCELFIEKQK